MEGWTKYAWQKFGYSEPTLEEYLWFNARLGNTSGKLTSEMTGQRWLAPTGEIGATHYQLGTIILAGPSKPLDMMRLSVDGGKLQQHLNGLIRDIIKKDRYYQTHGLLSLMSDLRELFGRTWKPSS
jgi:hypothetical protein